MYFKYLKIHNYYGLKLKFQYSINIIFLNFMAIIGEHLTKNIIGKKIKIKKYYHNDYCK